MLCFSTFKAANIIIYASQSNLKNINHIGYSKSFYLLTLYLTDVYSHENYNKIRWPEWSETDYLSQLGIFHNCTKI